MATSEATEHQRLSDLFAQVVANSKSFVAGFLSVDNVSDSASVQLVWNKMDLVNTVTQKYQVHHHVSDLTQTHPKALVSGFPVNWTCDYMSVSPSRKRVVTLNLEKEDGKKSIPGGVFNVFENHQLVSTFKPPKTLHGTIYLGEREGGIAWSHDEQQIVYIAEKKVSESPAFWENANTKNERKDHDDKTETKLPGTKFEYEDDWGEQYEGKKTASMFLATLATGKIQEVKGVPHNVTCADVAFVPGDKELVFAGTETDFPKRLGLIYCYNRPMTLYHVVLDQDHPAHNVVKKLELIPQDKESESIGTMRNPRFSPDGKHLAFLATRDVATHGTCSFLCVTEWATKHTTTIIPIKDEPDAAERDDVTKAFNGLFTGNLSERAWSSDSKTIFVHTQVGSRVVWKYVDVTTKQLVSPEYVEGVAVAMESVLDRSDNHFLVMVSSPTRPASIYLVHIDQATGTYVRLPLSIDDQQGATTYLKRWEVYSIPTSVSDVPAASKNLPTIPPVLENLLLPSVSSSSPYEATVMLPSRSPPADGYPVLLELHGGPHGNTSLLYRSMWDFWAALGFAIITVNYRGSTGFGMKALESLIGKVGTQDVYDCHYALCYLLEHSSSFGLSLDKSRVHCSGGSHGGFLVTHLIAQFPGFYKSMVTRNPVTNLASMFYTTDIQDWNLACIGIQRFEAIHTSQKLQKGKDQLPVLTPEVRLAILSKLWQHSPVGNDLSQVATPSLFGLGGKDKRVPPTQGLEYRATILSYGVPTQLLWYPKDSHPLGSVEAYGDFAVNWGLWVLKYNNTE